MIIIKDIFQPFLSLDDILENNWFGFDRVGDFKLIEGYPGLFDGWETDNNIALTNDLDLLNGGKRAASPAKRSGYSFDWGAIIPYVAQNSHHVYLFNLAGKIVIIDIILGNGHMISMELQ